MGVARIISVGLAIWLVGCGITSIQGDVSEDTTDDTTTSGDPLLEVDVRTDAPADDSTETDAEPSALTVAEICAEILGTGAFPLWGERDPTQDEFCEDLEDCHISSGNPGPDGIVCPGACSCLCYEGMTFMLACTMVDCDLPGTCRP
jgi:hypothetical protein